MRKISYITILACLSLFTLQGIWLSKTYNSYQEMLLSEIEDNIKISISRELSMRGKGSVRKDSETNVRYKYAEDMSPEEIQSHKGDTISISIANKMAVGNTLEDVILQIRQDRHMFSAPLSLPILDTIFIDVMGADFDHCFISLDKDKQVTEICGKDVRNKHNVIKTKEFPVGTKGLLYIQAFVKVPLNDYLKSMVYILSVSVMIIMLVFVTLIFQFSVIRKKEAQLVFRESCINGTIHDLKSPLGNVVTLLAWIGDEETDKDKKALIGSGSVKVRRLIGDIEQILTTAKAKGEIIHLNYSEVKPIELIESAKDKISSNLSAKPRSLSISDEVGEGTLRCDRMYIENVIRNLIENSLKYSDPGVSVSIRIFKEDKMMGISVKDNGWGIDKKYRKKVFREYFQAPNEGKTKVGYGIGLSYSKHIIKSHKGKMTLYSHHGEGTTITIFLPL